MTVREYIEYLKTLDQDKGIWISYDGANRGDCGYTNGIFKPKVDAHTIGHHFAKYAKKWYNDDVKVGDYLISIG